MLQPSLANTLVSSSSMSPPDGTTSALLVASALLQGVVIDERLYDCVGSREIQLRTLRRNLAAGSSPERRLRLQSSRLCLAVDTRSALPTLGHAGIVILGHHPAVSGKRASLQ